jgi:predicted transcriptional regulator
MKITVRSDGFEGYAQRSLERAKKLTRREKVEPEMTITFESPLSMLEVLTPERIRLCQVARAGSFSLAGLAAELRRDTKSVRRDVTKLERMGMLRTRIEPNPGHGRMKIVEAVAQKFELRAQF